MDKNKIDKIVVVVTQWFGVILFLFAVIWVGSYLLKTQRYEQTNDAQVEAYLSPVSAKVGGYIQKINFRDNQKVHRGDTLALIEPDEFQLKREAAFAELLSAHAKLGILSASEETQQKNMEVISAGISGSRATLDHQQQEYDRYQKLLNDESTTPQKFENVSAILKISQSAFSERQASLKAAESKLKDIKANRSAIRAEIRTKEALLASQDLSIRYTVITAPFDGQLGKKTIQAGQLVQPGQTLVFLTNESVEKWVVANFKETQIGKFTVGQKAEVTVDAFPDEIFSGVVESLSPTTGSRYSILPPDNATGNFIKITQRIPIRIKLTDGNGKLSRLSAGMNANVSIKK